MKKKFFLTFPIIIGFYRLPIEMWFLIHTVWEWDYLMRAWSSLKENDKTEWSEKRQMESLVVPKYRIKMYILTFSISMTSVKSQY